MAHIKNPTAYWNIAHNSEKNKQLNIELEYFFTNSYSNEKRIYNLINHINTWGREFDYITNYEPYANILKSLPNLIIDHKNQKFILIPTFVSVDEARTFSNVNYYQFKKFIEDNLYNIPSIQFLEFINNNRYRVVYVANNFNEIISNCEKRNSIKISINLIDYNINYSIVPKVSVVEAPKTYTVPVVPVVPVVPAIPKIQTAPTISNTPKKVYIAPALRPKVVESKPPPKPITDSVLDTFGLSDSLLNEFINEDCPKSKINMSGGGCGSTTTISEKQISQVEEFVDDCPHPKINPSGRGVYYEKPVANVSPKVIVQLSTKTNFINFNDSKFQKLKDKIINELTNNPTEENLVWLNSLYHNLFIYPEFIDKVAKSEYLMFDHDEQKLIRKPFEVVRHKKYNIYNPEEND
jgi:hypothetical protein